MIADLEKRNESVRLWKLWCAAFQILDTAPEDIDDRAYEELQKAEQDAHDAYQAAGPLIENDDGTDVERCALTGVPILGTDDIVMCLRSALPEKQEKAA